ncbi:hypothetical protein NOR53_3495 [gamma proteobacterium NOR5-3]|nr:hypothetical protein NOR53_3495 [gamma proteobacterium NOR5-3]
MGFGAGGVLGLYLAGDWFPWSMVGLGAGFMIPAVLRGLFALRAN